MQRQMRVLNAKCNALNKKFETHATKDDDWMKKIDNNQNIMLSNQEALMRKLDGFVAIVQPADPNEDLRVRVKAIEQQHKSFRQAVGWVMGVISLTLSAVIADRFIKH